MKKESISLFDIRSAAACLLALVVKQMFPATLLAGTKVTPLGFYCDFSFQGPFEPQYLVQIEEMMQAWVRQKIEIQIREMVSRSAKEYFSFHREPLLVKHIENSPSPTFCLAQILGKMVLSDSSVSIGNLGEITAFSLQKTEEIGSKLRIYGSVFFDKKELKEFLKASEEWSSSSHIATGKKLKLFEETEEGEWLWFAKGQKMRRVLKKFLENEEEKFGFSRVSSIPICEDISLSAFSETHEKIFDQEQMLKTIKISECATFCLLEGNDSSSGLLDPSIFQGLRSHVFCQKKDLLDELISSLHFMTKIFKILGFAFKPILFEVRKGKFKEISSLFSKALENFKENGEMEICQAVDGVPRIEWTATDGLGRNWPFACISAVLMSREEISGFASSTCLSIERMVALLLEKGKGYCPFWLCPLQIRVVPLQKNHRPLAEKAMAFLESEGFRTELCIAGEELKMTLREALEEGVPYVVVIGDKELETDTITLRDVRAKQAQSLPWQELIEVLRKVN